MRRTRPGSLSKRPISISPALKSWKRSSASWRSASPLKRLTMLEQVDLKLKLSRAEYEKTKATLQNQLHLLAHQVYEQKRPVVLVFEGWDAAGKGGAIKRLTEKMDPRGYIVHPIAAPQGEDKTHHYLYRFWRRLPEAG